MKQCPDCHETFDDEQRFCDIDGSLLLDETALLRNALQHGSVDGTQTSGPDTKFSWSTVTIGVLAGIVLCLSIYAVTLVLFPDAERRTADRTNSTRRPLDPSYPSQAISTLVPRPTVEASIEPSPSPVAEDSPSPSVKPVASTEQKVAANVNNGPVSTGSKRGYEVEQAIIKMKDGTSVSADAAWEDSQGVWYRQGGLVSFVDRNRVETITEAPRSIPSPSGGNKP